MTDKNSLADRAAESPCVFSRIIASAFEQGMTRDYLEANAPVSYGSTIPGWKYGSHVPESAERRRIVAWLQERLPGITA
jgi:hypothetical protein